MELAIIESKLSSAKLSEKNSDSSKTPLSPLQNEGKRQEPMSSEIDAVAEKERAMNYILNEFGYDLNEITERGPRINQEKESRVPSYSDVK